MTVSGKAVLITGAARGLGAEAARRLARQGARVSLVGLEPEELGRVAQECGPDAVWFEADVTDRDQLRAAVDGTIAALGGIDAVIANAGIATSGLVRSTPEEAWERVIEVNVLGVYRTVKACLPQIVERQGYVLIIASMAAAVHAGGMSSYTASKAAVEAFGDALRVEVAHHGVDVGVGYFSWIDTEMVRGAERDRLGSFLRSRLKGPAGRTHRVEKAGEAIARGVIGRRRRVVVPSWGKLVLLFRDTVQLLGERTSKRHMPQAEAIAEEEARTRGAAAFAAVGAGGAAFEAAHGGLAPSGANGGNGAAPETGAVAGATEA
jgi:NAD(P)-dependent dehydrogenase (short-subunit alcohol dehydrogenase family)